MKILSFLVINVFIVISNADSGTLNSVDKILELTDGNFQKTLKLNRYVLVDFYAQACSLCQDLLPKMERVVQMLTKLGSKMTVAKSNAGTQMKVRQKYNINAVPTLILFNNASANAIPLLEISQEWDRFLEIYKPQYKDSAEYGYRKKIFESNLENIKKHNIEYDMGLHTYRKGINQFTDKTNQEKRQGLCGFIPWGTRDNISPNKPTMPFTNDRNIPDSIDWRKRGAVTPVKYQGTKCGSCWAFSTTGALEGQYFLATNRLMSLSEQQLVDCAISNKGCISGNPIKAYFDLQTMGGITTESSYPYTANGHQKCQFKKEMAVADVIGYQRIAMHETSLKSAVALYGPISVVIEALDAFVEYNDGVFYDENCSDNPSHLNHAVLVVGYGSENGTDYWIVKNSWGDHWGENGYIKMRRNKANNCNIASVASYPKLKIQNHK